jgi:adenine deaminase
MGTEMKRTLLLLLTIVVVPAHAQTQRPGTKTTEITNAEWFTGDRFVRQTMYVSGSFFTARRPAHVDQRIDLAGHYIVPPYGDAHTHAFGSPASVAAASAAHVRQGVFYALNLLNSVSTRDSIARELRTLAGVDVGLASAGLTGPRGHPILSEEMAANG